MFVAYQAFIRISLDVQNISASNLEGNPAYVSDIQRTYLMWFDIIYFPKTIILTNVPIAYCAYCLLNISYRLLYVRYTKDFLNVV